MLLLLEIGLFILLHLEFGMLNLVDIFGRRHANAENTCRSCHTRVMETSGICHDNAVSTS